MQKNTRKSSVLKLEMQKSHRRPSSLTRDWKIGKSSFVRLDMQKFPQKSSILRLDVRKNPQEIQRLEVANNARPTWISEPPRPCEKRSQQNKKKSAFQNCTFAVFTVFAQSRRGPRTCVFCWLRFAQDQVGSEGSCTSRSWKNSGRAMHCTELFFINYGLRNRLHVQPVTQRICFRISFVINSGTTVVNVRKTLSVVLPPHVGLAQGFANFSFGVP